MKRFKELKMTNDLDEFNVMEIEDTTRKIEKVELFQNNDENLLIQPDEGFLEKQGQLLEEEKD